VWELPFFLCIVSKIKWEEFIGMVIFNFLYDMNKVEIGSNACKVWQLLSDHKLWTYKELEKATGLGHRELGAALGWLVREEKVELEECGEDVNVYLCVNVYIG